MHRASKIGIFGLILLTASHKAYEMVVLQAQMELPRREGGEPVA